MKAPTFWYRPRGFLSALLHPLGWVYDRGGKLLSHLKKPQHFSVPILSVGNIVSGGSGKTPTSIALAHLLSVRGHQVHFVTRGYGGKAKGPVKVDPLNHQAKDVGDEPLLLAEHAPTWMAKKRLQGIQKAIENGAQIIILDDGHQTTGLHKDVSLVVIDLLQGFGNGDVIPAGPLRENLARGLERADGVILIGEFKYPSPAPKMLPLPQRERVFIPKNSSPLMGEVDHSREPIGRVRGPHFKAQITPHPLKLPSNRIIAFCGLGFPEKFYSSLEKKECELIETHSFPDHYEYTENDLLKLQKRAQKHSCVLITTRKDFIKIPPSWQKLVYVLDIIIEFEDPEKICDFILQKIRFL